MKSNDTLRVALLRGDDYHNVYLERLLANGFALVCVVAEPGRAQRKAIWMQHHWVDAFAAEYHRMRRWVTGKKRFRRHYFSSLHDDFSGGSRPSPVLVESVNDSIVAATVRTSNPDICVITCTTKLDSKTILDIEVPIINIHGGHLPDYRGCHCVFAALTESRFDAIGSTIHFIDVGLDTGDIIEVVKPAVRPTDDAEMLYSRAERLAAQRLVELLKALESGESLPRSPQAFRGKLVLRRSRTPMDDIRFWRARGSGRLVIPNLPGGVPRHPWESCNWQVVEGGTVMKVGQVDPSS